VFYTHGRDMKHYILYICLVITTCCFSACTNDHTIAKRNIKRAKINSPLEEYVNRVAKRILIVSHNPSSHYIFSVTQDNTPLIEIDPQSNSIIISHGLLTNLLDEAELAAVLSLAIAKLNHNPDPDRSTLTNLAHAGYDPQALVDLQERYLLADPIHPTTWIVGLDSSTIDAGTVTYNKEMLKKLPHGLMRGTEQYQKQIGNL